MISEYWVSIEYRGMKKPFRLKSFSTREKAMEEIKFRKILDKANHSRKIPYVIEEVII